MDQVVEVVGEGNLISIQEKMKSFSSPLMQCGVSELKFQTVFKYFSRLAVL
jgi:hypothetical protein